MSPQIPRGIDDNSPSRSDVNDKPTNKLPGYVVKEEASVFKRNNDNDYLNDSSKVVHMNICINNQIKVSFIIKNDTIENKLYDRNFLVKNTTLTSENEESSNKKSEIVVEKDSFEEGELNGSTECNETMNAKERKHKESNEVTKKHVFNTVRKMKKYLMLLTRVMSLGCGLVNKFLGNVTVPVIQLSSFRTIQFLVHYQIRIRKDL